MVDSQTRHQHPCLIVMIIFTIVMHRDHLEEHAKFFQKSDLKAPLTYYLTPRLQSTFLIPTHQGGGGGEEAEGGKEKKKKGAAAPAAVSFH